MREALEKVEARGGTALYDAVVASADYMKHNARLQKKVLFVVTDGEDNASRESLEETVRRLQEENGPTVYAIGLLGEEKAAPRPPGSGNDCPSAPAELPSCLSTLDEVDEISRDVAHDIRNQYTIGYKPTTPKSVGGYRAIQRRSPRQGLQQTHSQNPQWLLRRPGATPRNSSRAGQEFCHPERQRGICIPWYCEMHCDIRLGPSRD